MKPFKSITGIVKRFLMVSLFPVFSLFLWFQVFQMFQGSLYARDESGIHKTFNDKKAIQLQTFSGECIIKKSSSSRLELRFIPSSGTGFEPEFKEQGDTLIAKEKFHLSGDSTWNLFVPENFSIQFQSISGNFTAEGIKGNISATTVSGNISARDCQGEISLKCVSGGLEVKNLSGTINLTAVSGDLEINDLSGEIRIKAVSGDIDANRLEGSVSMKCPAGDINIKEAKASFEIKTASGDIDAKSIIITKSSSFTAASGSIYVGLAKSAGHDLTLESASGDSVLNYNGNPITGYFEFKAATDQGDIISPFPFQKEEEIEKWGKKYSIKSFKKEGTPKISIYTASGKAELKIK